MEDLNVTDDKKLWCFHQTCIKKYVFHYDRYVLTDTLVPMTFDDIRQTIRAELDAMRARLDALLAEREERRDRA